MRLPYHVSQLGSREPGQCNIVTHVIMYLGFLVKFSDATITPATMPQIDRSDGFLCILYLSSVVKVLLLY